MVLSAPRVLAAALAATPWIERHLPAPLLGEGPEGLRWWQWLAIPVYAAASLLLGAALGFLTRRVLHQLAARTHIAWADALVARAATPIALLWSIAVFYGLRPSLHLEAEASGQVGNLLHAGVYLAVFWGLLRAIDVAFAAAAAAPRTAASASLVGLLPLMRRISKLVLFALGLVAVLNELGFQVASLLAGLGIGGVALALAAQKTVENLFGSVAIGVDQPFRVGDFIKVEDVVGTVEAIGMRSTRIRTLDRTLVTFPNGKLADLKAESFAARDRFRLLQNLSLSYATTEAQLRAVLVGIEGVLRAHPRTWPEVISVRFTEFREFALNVEVMAWLQGSDWSAFTADRQELLLRFMAVVEEAGASFAFPTRTVHLATERPREG
jgi:MscS family membrane protein